tara:strand:+ start:141 stop:2204 length:2064 start_codon:yes stop_codon:yes gene_type:complete
MPLSKFIFKPGINREGTSYDNSGGWFDVNLVRFRKGRPEKFGGWSKETPNTYLGKARALHGWNSLEGSKYLGLGTTLKYYIKEGDSFSDVTPIRLTTSAGDVTFSGKANTLSSGISATDTTIPLTSSTGFPASGTIQIGSETINYAAISSNNLIGVTRGAENTTAATHSSSDAVLCATLTITDTSHGAVQNDFVTFSGASSLGGNITAAVLNQEYQVLNVINANSYTIKAKDTSSNTVFANSSDSGNGGSSVVGTYQINVGLDDFVTSTGWGAGAWGEGTFGSSTALSSTNQLRLWTHDNFGENIIINPRAGGIYRWVENNGLTTRALELSQISGANLVPTKALQVITSEIDRHLIVLGADPISSGSRTGTVDPMLIAFSDQENELEFESLITNTAGSLRLSSGSSIIGATKSRQEILIWTDTALYSMQFVGPPFTFAVNLINEGTGLIGPKAAVTTASAIYWMSSTNFYTYNGSVKKIPCSVHNYVYGDINFSQSFKFHGFSITEKSEVGWFYCSSSASEIDRYVIYNYQDNIWYYGQLERYAWLDTGIEDYPRATFNNYLFQQETGFNNDGSPMTGVFIESSDIELSEGNQFTYIQRMFPDFKFLSNENGGKVNVVIKTRNNPGESLSVNSTNSIASTTGQVNLRARTRQAVIRVESDDDDVNGNDSVGWRLGATRLDIKTDGRR